MSKKNKEKKLQQVLTHKIKPLPYKAQATYGDNSESYTYMAKDILDKIIEKSASYTYDVNADPLYQQYKDMYQNEGSLAAKDIFGLASALTGGYGNSYASTLAIGAKESFSDKLALKQAELEKESYDRHRDDIEDMYSLYGAYSDMSQREYERERNEKQDEAQRQENAVDFAWKAAANGDYSYLESMGVNVSKLRKDEAFGDAEFFAEYGDYSKLKELGLDISKLNYNELADQGEFFAKFGDYSVLKELGVDLNNMKEEELLELAEVYAKYGDYSLLKYIGVDTSDRETQEYYDRLLTWARYLKALRW